MVQFNYLPNDFQLQSAKAKDLDVILQIIKQAKGRRKSEGSDQWQNGYPNREVINEDIINGYGYLLMINSIAAGYMALIFDGEIAYNTIDGKWLTVNNNYLVIHRVAVADSFLNQGIATSMLQLSEEIGLKRNVESIRIDTNFDNQQMLHILKKLEYIYCGEIYLQSGIRRGYEKLLR